MPENVQYEMSLNDLVSPKLQNADKNAKQFESTLTGLQGTLNKVAVAAGAAFAVDKIFDFGKAVVAAGTQVEDARVGLTTLLKDSEGAADVISNTMEDATKTPFAFEGLLSANKALISAGEDAEGARTAVLDLANAIAATGGGDAELQRMVVNLQQIRNTGQATALDIKQFAYAGINVYQALAEATGKPIEKVKDMEVSYDLLTMALAKAHDQGGIYANGLENMAKNTSVQLSNLGDSLFQFKVKMFQDFKPAIDEGIASTKSFIDSLSDLYDYMKSPEAAKTAREWMNEVAIAAKSMAIGVAVAGLAFVVAYPQVLIYTGALIANTIAGYGLTIATNVLTAAQWLLNAAMNANPIGIVVAGIALLVTGLAYAYQKSETFRAALAGLGEIAKSLWGIFKGLATTVIGIFTFNPSLIKQGIVEAANAAGGIAGAFEKGYNQSLADSALEREKQAKEDSQKEQVTTGTDDASKLSNIKATQKTSPIKAGTETKSKVTGSRNTTIHINIGALVKELKINTTNLRDTGAKIQEEVTKVLISAVNDSQVIAE